MRGLLALVLCVVATSAPLPLRVAFIGNSLSGGGGVGGSPGQGCSVAWPQPQPSPSEHNPGDVPSKVKSLAIQAGTDFTWKQNTRSSYFLRDHVSACSSINTGLLADTQAVVVQGHSAEFQVDNCAPTQQQINDVNSLFAPAPSTAGLYVMETWTYYNYTDDDGKKAEICFSEQVRCTIATLVSKLQRPAKVIPIGLAFRLLADAVCPQRTNPDYKCAEQTLDFGGYSSSSCNQAIWSVSGAGVFAVSDVKHQSEAAGAWLSALVVYGTLHACLPPSNWLKNLAVPLFTELTNAARAALSQTYYFRRGFPECATGNWTDTFFESVKPSNDE